MRGSPTHRLTYSPTHLIPMYYIDPHIHMVSRTTDDYETLAKMGCVAVSEPAFWAGYDRGSVDGFRDYFEQLTAFEPKRAGWYGIQHFTWLCINAKEAENVALSREVIAMIPEFLEPAGRAGHRRDRAEQEHAQRGDRVPGALDLAVRTDEQILIHTPHLEDKYQGTRMILDMLCDDGRINRERVLVDHVEEHTVRHVLDEGFWAGMTLYPVSEVHAGAGGGHRRDVRPRAVAGELGRRLGPVEADGRARLHPGNASPRPRGESHPPGCLREPAAVLRPKPQLRVHTRRTWLSTQCV